MWTGPEPLQPKAYGFGTWKRAFTGNISGKKVFEWKLKIYFLLIYSRDKLYVESHQKKKKKHNFMWVCTGVMSGKGVSSPNLSPFTFGRSLLSNNDNKTAGANLDPVTSAWAPKPCHSVRPRRGLCSSDLCVKTTSAEAKSRVSHYPLHHTHRRAHAHTCT